MPTERMFTGLSFCLPTGFPPIWRASPVSAFPWKGCGQNVRPLRSRRDNLPQMGEYDELVLLWVELLCVPERPGHAEIMVGGEYTATSGARGGAKCFNGWTWFTAVRFHF